MLESIHHTIHRKVSEIFDLYTELHGIRISLFNPDGTLIYPDPDGRPDCGHCRLLRQQLGMDSKCRALDQKMMEQALARGEMVTYTCHAGMIEVVAPLFVDGEVAGFVMPGQFRSEATPAQSPYLHLGGEKLQAEYEQTPIYPEEKIEILLSLFQLLIEFIISKQLIHHKDYDLVHPVIEAIQDNPKCDLSLNAAAQLVGRSPSTVSRLFKKMTGHSFKQYQTAHRMELAAQRLRTLSNHPIGDIARSIGYDDPLYFSRAFRKFYGLSPSQYRAGQSER